MHLSICVFANAFKPKPCTDFDNVVAIKSDQQMLHLSTFVLGRVKIKQDFLPGTAKLHHNVKSSCRMRRNNLADSFLCLFEFYFSTITTSHSGGKLTENVSKREHG